MLSKWKKRVRLPLVDKREGRDKTVEPPSTMFPVRDVNPWKCKGNDTPGAFVSFLIL